MSHAGNCEGNRCLVTDDLSLDVGGCTVDGGGGVESNWCGVGDGG